MTNAKPKKFKMIHSIYMNSTSCTRRAGQTFVTDNKREEEELLSFVESGAVVLVESKKKEDKKGDGDKKGAGSGGGSDTPVDLAELPGIGRKTVEKLAALDPPVVTVEGVKEFVQKQPDAAKEMMGHAFKTVEEHFADPAPKGGDAGVDAGAAASSREGDQA